jgi:lipopolysaccharide/colanic/teichoic acid biosynthesis glycosyltransferase
MRARVEHDLHYIDNPLWFDVRILRLTILSRSTHRNAH